MTQQHHGSLIAIAWPETNVIQVNMWYDHVTRFFGFTKNQYYKAGHAALILVDSKTNETHYFDFGRYHTPPKYGRVRCTKTDPELALKTNGKFGENGKLTNSEEILNELISNPATHGDGKTIYGVLNHIDYPKAFDFVHKMVNQGALPYGPFDPRGTNCSRFVAQTIRASKGRLICRIKTRFPKTLSASPVGNVKNITTPITLSGNINIPLDRNSPADRNLDRTLKKPELPKNLDKTTHWLSGEGAGSWFSIQPTGSKDIVYISRFTPKGKLEYSAKYSVPENFNLQNPYQFTYLSHAQEVNLLQKGIKHTLIPV